MYNVHFQVRIFYKTTASKNVHPIVAFSKRNPPPTSNDQVMSNSKASSEVVIVRQQRDKFHPQRCSGGSRAALLVMHMACGCLTCTQESSIGVFIAEIHPVKRSLIVTILHFLLISERE